MFFLLSVKKGGSRPNQKILIRKYSDFLTIFDHFLTIFDHFSSKGGGSGLGQVKKSLSEKTEVVKKVEGGSPFFY